MGYAGDKMTRLSYTEVLKCYVSICDVIGYIYYTGYTGCSDPNTTFILALVKKSGKDCYLFVLIPSRVPRPLSPYEHPSVVTVYYPSQSLITDGTSVTDPELLYSTRAPPTYPQEYTLVLIKIGI